MIFGIKNKCAPYLWNNERISSSNSNPLSVSPSIQSIRLKGTFFCRGIGISPTTSGASLKFTQFVTEYQSIFVFAEAKFSNYGLIDETKPSLRRIDTMMIFSRGNGPMQACIELAKSRLYFHSCLVFLSFTRDDLIAFTKISNSN